MNFQAFAALLILIPFTAFVAYTVIHAIRVLNK